MLDVPAYQLDLPGTEWTITEINELPLTPSATLAFEDPPNGGVTVRTACREYSLSYTMDTDGSALSFELPPARPAECVGEAAQQDDLVTRALIGTSEWDYLSDRQIELRGGQVVRLDRIDSN